MRLFSLVSSLSARSAVLVAGLGIALCPPATFAQEALDSPGTRAMVWNDPNAHRTDLAAEGGIGLFRIPSAELGQVGELRLGLVANGFLAGNFPVRGAREQFAGTRLSVSYLPMKYLEAYLNLSDTSSRNEAANRPLIQTIGGVLAGLKAAAPVGKPFHMGVDAQFLAYQGTRTLTQYAFGFQPRLLAELDVRKLVRYAPVRVHVATGARLDWNPGLGDSTLRAAEDFGLGANRYARFVFSAGAEIPLPWVTGFAEYALSLPLGVASSGLISPDGSVLTPLQAMQQSVSLGAKVTAIRDVTFLAGVELGLNRNVAFGVPSTAPFNFFLGVSYHTDVLPRSASHSRVEVVEAKAAPIAPWIVGRVIDAQTHASVAGAMISLSGTDLPPVASDSEGRFRSYAIERSDVTLEVSHEGYEAAKPKVVLHAGEPTAVEVQLRPLTRNALLTLKVTAAGQPVEAQVAIEGDAEQLVRLPANALKPVEVELPPGKYHLTITAKGFLGQVRQIQLSRKAEMTVEIELRPVPAQPAVELKGNHLELSQTVHFAKNKAKLMPDSYPLLLQVVDALVKNGIGLVRIEGHTDNRGSASVNQRLSEERAQAVMDYLIVQGVDPERLQAAGYGGTRPVTLNLTPRGRELNRRVEFIVLKR